MAGVQAIQFQEIDAWMRLTGTRLQPIEIELICQLDNEYRSANAEKQQEEARKRETASRSTAAKSGKGGW